jgi:truncated hemoglobin YjbI
MDKSKKSIYEQIGGAAAIPLAVHKFYNERVLKDPKLFPFFKNSDAKKQIKM